MKNRPAILDYFQKLPVGEAVNKKGLAYLKRMGYIWDYSRFGYLESLHIFGALRPGEQFKDEFWLEISPKGKCKEAEKFDGAMYEKWRQCGSARCDLSMDEMLKLFGPQGHFEIDGITFRPKYFDGCFKPYLVKDGPANGERVNHRMAFLGRLV